MRVIINSNGDALWLFLEEFAAGGDEAGPCCDDFIIAL